MAQIFTHTPNQELTLISGWYRMEKEQTLQREDQEFLYMVGTGCVDSSCCGSAGFRYAIVPGRILKWKYAKDDAGFDLTEIAPVRTESLQKDIQRILMKKEDIQQVQFW